jgi:hypothetical protein
MDPNAPVTFFFVGMWVYVGKYSIWSHWWDSRRCNLVGENIKKGRKQYEMWKKNEKKR